MKIHEEEKPVCLISRIRSGEMKMENVFGNFDAILKVLAPKQCAITIAEGDTFSLYGEPLCPESQEHVIMCRIEGATQLINDSQTVVSFCKL